MLIAVHRGGSRGQRVRLIVLVVGALEVRDHVHLGDEEELRSRIGWRASSISAALTLIVDQLVLQQLLVGPPERTMRVVSNARAPSNCS